MKHLVVLAIAACHSPIDPVIDVTPDAPVEVTDATTTPLSFSWSKFLAIKYEDPTIGRIGGTELRSIVPMEGKLYAGNSYWQDADRGNPALPGPQVLRRDSPTSPWVIDLPLPASYLAVGALSSVTFSNAPSPILLASVWDPAGSLPVFSKLGSAGTWVQTPLASTAPPGAQIRSFGFHKDSVTHVELAFAGSDPNGIFSGPYDATVAGSIHWRARVETLADHTIVSGERVMSFAEANGKLYATIGWNILERQDGTNPSWKTVFTWGHGLPLNGGGALRALTAIPNPAGPGQVFLVAAEKPANKILRIDPSQGFAAVVELDTVAFASKALNVTVDDTLVAYNDMVSYGPAACPSRLLGGFHANAPGAPGALNNTWYPGANILIRDCKGAYTSVAVVDPAVKPTPALLAVRTIALSPFSQDPAGTIYVGGFDAGGVTVHNTAWLYKGVPASQP